MLGNTPDHRNADRGDDDAQPGGIPPRLLRVVSLVVVLALILAASSVIIAATDGGIWIVLLIVAVSAGLVYRWGFRSTPDRPGSDDDSGFWKKYPSLVIPRERSDEESPGGSA